MKNILFWGWAEFDASMAVQAIASDPNIRIVEWIADKDTLDKSYKKFIYNSPEFSQFRLPRYDQALTSDELVKFLDMFSREKRARGINFHEQKNIASTYFRYFLWLLKEKDVDHVLFSIIPIIGFDYLCYLAAARLGITVTMCCQSLFPDRFFYCSKIDDFGKFDTPTEQDTSAPPDIDWGYQKDLFYMKGNEIKNRRKSPALTWLRETIRHGIRTSSKPMRYSGVVENLTQARDFEKYYSTFAKKREALDVSINFVYFPLHLQPELTTSTLGGDYSDQLDAIERLSDMLPPDWKIYVKENPKQGPEQRGVEFYRRISCISNVEYIGNDVDTYWLMHKCRFVATITGTAGWESITGGKPCLTFGLAWYANIPGAISYSKDVSVEKILSLQIDQAAQAVAFSNLYKKMRTGIIDGGFESIYPSYTPQTNAIKLANFIRERIYSDK